jgi:dipeptidyl aminopeptidase/acylaminoacyl peptidase
LSPITYAHQCTTPALFLVGEADHRCPPEQSEQFYTVLKAEGCPVEMVRFPGGGHMMAVMGSPEMRKVQNEALLEWMDRYIPGRN